MKLIEIEKQQYDNWFGGDRSCVTHPPNDLVNKNMIDKKDIWVPQVTAREDII
jgi:hypothetical protein